MPVTRGQGNPDWNRDETILALDLLYRHGKPLDKRHGDVQELSNLLRAANIHPPAARNDRFRNPDGVALKLQNLLSATDPTRSLSSTITDRAVVGDFPFGKANEVAVLAAAIRALIEDGEPFEPADGEDEAALVEGEWLAGRHRRRERQLRIRLLASHPGDQLKCEVCDHQAPATLNRELQESNFEAHHTIPLAAAEGQRATRLRDMALLCVCCHRLIHKKMSIDRRWISVEECRAFVQAAKAAA